MTITMVTVAVKIRTGSLREKSAAVLSLVMYPKAITVKPQIKYPTEINTLRRFIRSLHAPMIKVVITAVAADRATIRLMALITPIDPSTACCGASA